MLGCGAAAMGVLITARIASVAAIATIRLAIWSALNGPTSGLRQFMPGSNLRPQEAERAGEDGQPVEEDRETDDHHEPAPR